MITAGSSLYETPTGKLSLAFRSFKLQLIACSLDKIGVGNDFPDVVVDTYGGGSSGDAIYLFNDAANLRAIAHFNGSLKQYDYAADEFVSDF